MQRYGRTRREVKQDKEKEYNQIEKLGTRREAEKAFRRPAYQSIDVSEYCKRKGIVLDRNCNVKEVIDNATPY